MTELSQPITSPLGMEAKPNPKESGFCYDLGAGLQYGLPSSVTEETTGYQFDGTLYRCPNSRDIYGLGLQLNFDKNEGGDFYSDQDHSRTLLVLSRDQKNIYTGFGKVGETKTLELGSDIYSSSHFWRTSGIFGFSLRPYLGTLSAIPFDSQGSETISLLQLKVGVDLRLTFLDRSTTPPPEGLTDYDVTYYMLAGLHRLGQAYGTSKALSGPSAQAQDYTEELFGEGGLPSSRQEGIGALNVVNLWGAAGKDNEELQLQLRATGDQKGWMTGEKIILTGAAFAFSRSDKSPTMLTYGFAGGLEIVNLWMAQGLDRNLESRRLLNQKTNKEKEGDFILYSSLLNALAFLGGWQGQDSKAGQALLQAGQEAMMARGSSLGQNHPLHFVYEWQKDGSRFLGLEQTTSLSSSNLYINTRLLGQAAPAGPAKVQELADDATGRDPLYEGAKAKASAALGLETATDSVTWSAGVRTLLEYGEGPRPLPGVGGEAQMLLGLGKENWFEAGLGVSADRVGGEFQLGASVVAGLKLPSF